MSDFTVFVIVPPDVYVPGLVTKAAVNVVLDGTETITYVPLYPVGVTPEIVTVLPTIIL